MTLNFCFQLLPPKNAPTHEPSLRPTRTNNKKPTAKKAKKTTAKNKNAKKTTAKNKNTKKTTAKAKNAKKTSYAYELGDSLHAPWQDALYPAQVFSRRELDDGTKEYGIYFCDDYENKHIKHVEEGELKPMPKNALAKDKRARAWYLGKKFSYPGDRKLPGGTFVIKEVGKGKQQNHYKCEKIDGGRRKRKEYVYFTIAFCMFRFYKNSGV